MAIKQVGALASTPTMLVTKGELPTSGVATTVEIDFGVLAKRSFAITIVDALVLVTSRILANQSGLAATGRQADENEMDQYTVVAIPKAGTIRLAFASLPGCTMQGKSKINYLIA